jgi:TolB protein
MNEDGDNLERLTRDQGSNEDPHFSPDGNFLVFSSNRTGQKNIYVMNADGTGVKRLTYGLGNCTQPKWSPAATRRKK